QAHNAGCSAAAAAGELGLERDQLERAYRNIERKRSATRYLHVPPLLVDPVPEVDGPPRPPRPAGGPDSSASSPGPPARGRTEVLVHGYEQWGEGLLERLNGQFAFALHDRRTASLFLARDRFGILPLYYAERGGDLFFASEIKALFASGEVEQALDPEGLDEVFTF